MIVYLVTNKINGKQYVGQTIRSIEERWRDHCRVKDDNYFHRAIRKYGVNNFAVEVIDFAETTEELDEKEIFWIAKLNTLFPGGYNLRDGGNVSSRGKTGGLNRKSRLIYQFGMDGSMVNGYWGTAEAARKTGISDTLIYRSLKNENLLAGGYVWMYADSFSPEKLAKRIDSYPGMRWRSVVCVETGERFKSMTHAAKAYGTTPGSISACCAGRLKTTAGKHWKTL